MKHFVPFNKNGNVEISAKDLKDMLAEAYKEGYVQGQIDHVLKKSPSFSMQEDGESRKEKDFCQNGKTLIFRATIL